jgi:hypothetical protein
MAHGIWNKGIEQSAIGVRLQTYLAFAAANWSLSRVEKMGDSPGCRTGRASGHSQQFKKVRKFTQRLFQATLYEGSAEWQFIVLSIAGVKAKAFNETCPLRSPLSMALQPTGASAGTLGWANHLPSVSLIAHQFGQVFTKVLFLRFRPIVESRPSSPDPGKADFLV